jgi:hypothetical protein
VCSASAALSSGAAALVKALQAALTAWEPLNQDVERATKALETAKGSFKDATASFDTLYHASAEFNQQVKDFKFTPKSAQEALDRLRHAADAEDIQAPELRHPSQHLVGHPANRLQGTIGRHALIRR